MLSKHYNSVSDFNSIMSCPVKLAFPDQAACVIVLIVTVLASVWGCVQLFGCFLVLELVTRHICRTYKGMQLCVAVLQSHEQQSFVAAT